MAAIDAISRVMGKASYTKPLKKLGKWFEKNPEGALAGATVTSIILKDGIGCAMYVTQSLNNKKIPDEKRKFVAALDLTNGLLMILAQIGMFFAMRKYSGPIFKKIFGKSFSALAKNHTISRMQMKAAKVGKGWAKRLKLEKVFDKVEKSGLDLFKFVADIAAATIIGKRVIVPLIATPLAKKVEAWMNKGKEPSKTQSDEASKIQEPSMQGNNPQTETKKAESTNLLEKYRQQAK